ncbi:MAG: c-type cytochrome, partial [Gemmatimonadetes bacterium]|nr:cytochrome c [Gemmatimonadota bacterium]NIQ58995.1 cytochrome c [Gemmatimonadota bacterium]NIU79202.1 c-type cytochrome [Gammaproteobacteria bacterium]NIX47883.1 c-type cytochrome [Gemmatimonadota bacterium]NIY12254.1 c-type cytochrome [Gemmatimonadota bacterium]
VACGDPETSDARGYTKAPLEDPGILVDGEEPTAMAELGTPDRPRAERGRSELPEQAGPEEPAAGQGQADAPEPDGGASGGGQDPVEQGREVFAGSGGCGACHGPDGSGSQLGPDLTDGQWLHVSEPTVEAIAEVIRAGVAQPAEHPAPMPPMGGASLSDEQLRAVAAYVASLS